MLNPNYVVEKTKMSIRDVNFEEYYSSKCPENNWIFEPLVMLLQKEFKKHYQLAIKRDGKLYLINIEKTYDNVKFDLGFDSINNLNVYQVFKRIYEILMEDDKINDPDLIKRYSVLEIEHGKIDISDRINYTLFDKYFNDWAEEYDKNHTWYREKTLDMVRKENNSKFEKVGCFFFLITFMLAILLAPR